MQTHTLANMWHFVLRGSVSVVVSGIGANTTPYYSLAA
jgi:hypothetical protein